MKNNFFLPTSTPHFLQGPETFPSDELRTYYIHLARNGAGLIFVRAGGGGGGGTRSRKGQTGDSAHMAMFDESDPGVENYVDQLIEGIHIYGAKVCGQVGVGGGGPMGPRSSGQGGQGQGGEGQGGAPGQDSAQGMPGGQEMPGGQSGPQGQGMPSGQGMPGGGMITSQVNTYTAEELEQMCETAAKSAKTMESRGFYALQVGIRGNYSASLALCKAVKKAVPDMIILTELFIREAAITPHPSDQYYQSAVSLEEGIKYAKQQEGAADILYIRIGDGSAAHATTWNSIKGKPYAIAYAEAIKKSGAKIYTAPGAGFQDLDLNEDYIASGKTDLITQARAFICDPEYGKKMSSGRGEDVVPCIRCNKCHGLSMSGPWYSVCSVNPKLGLPLAAKAIEAPTVQKKVAVIGGGEYGADVGMFLAKAGHNVTILTSERELVQRNRPHYPEIMVETYTDLKNFSIITQGTATAISAGKVTYKDAGGNEKSIQADNAVLFAGLKPKKDEALQFYGSAKQFFRIGDCSEQGGTIQRCTRGAFFAASEV